MTSDQSRPIMIVFVMLLLSSATQLVEAQDVPSPPDFGPGPPRVDLKMAIVMVLLVTVFFVLGFLSVYTRQCAQDRFRNRVELGFPGPHGGWSHPRGLDPEVIDTFPTFVYSSVKRLKLGSDSLECAVCLNEFEDTETLRLIPKCDHVFHPDCIDAWLVAHSTCPVCRADLIPKPGEIALPGSTLAELLSPIQAGPDPVRPEVVEQPRLNRDVSKAVKEEGVVDHGVPAIRPPRSRSTGFGLVRNMSAGIFSRSHSTGHSLVRPGESHERFTLRLPKDVRTQLVVNTAVLPRVASSRRGYRTVSVRRKDGAFYERFEPDGKDSRWGFSAKLPFVSRTGSVRGSKGAGSSSGDVGERSTDYLRQADDQV